MGEKKVDLSNFENQKNDLLETDNSKILVEVNNLTKIFPKGIWAIKKISFTIYRGDSIAILGSNGSGKSVLAKMLGNTLKPTSGNIDYFFNEDNIFKAIGYQSREQSWPGGFKVRDVYNLYLSIHEVKDKEWINKLIDVFLIEEIFNKRLQKLNIIRLQLFAIFLAMLHQPELLVIDELSAAISYDTRIKIINLLKDYVAKGNAVILVTPDDLLLNAVSNRVLSLNHGELHDDLSLEEINNQFGSSLEYIRLTTEENKTQPRKKKIIPYFQPIINKYNEFNKSLNFVFNHFFPEGLNSGNSDLDILVKNTIYFINLSEELILNTVSHSLIKTNVETTLKSLLKSEKEVKKTLKQIHKYQQKSSNSVKNLTKLIKEFEKILNFINKKAIPFFSNDNLIMKDDTFNWEITKDEKKKLKTLKKHYINEELRIAKLERKKQKTLKKISNMTDEQLDQNKEKIIKEHIELLDQITQGHQDVIKILQDDNANVVVKDDVIQISQDNLNHNNLDKILETNKNNLVDDELTKIVLESNLQELNTNKIISNILDEQNQDHPKNKGEK